MTRRNQRTSFTPQGTSEAEKTMGGVRDKPWQFLALPARFRGLKGSKDGLDSFGLVFRWFLLYFALFVLAAKPDGGSRRREDLCVKRNPRCPYDGKEGKYCAKRPLKKERR